MPLKIYMVPSVPWKMLNFPLCHWLIWCLLCHYRWFFTLTVLNDMEKDKKSPSVRSLLLVSYARSLPCLPVFLAFILLLCHGPPRNLVLFLRNKRREGFVYGHRSWWYSAHRWEARPVSSVGISCHSESSTWTCLSSCSSSSFCSQALLHSQRLLPVRIPDATLVARGCAHAAARGTPANCTHPHRPCGV